jgi:selenocysteine lyase/cysteine desulfurase
MSHATIRPAPGSSLEPFFDRFRRLIVGVDHRFESPSGTVPLVYADWTASGRLYGPIERRMLDVFGPLVGNTHSEATLTGTTMTRAYQEAKAILKAHVHAGPRDVVLTAGSGMTAVVNKLIRILGLRVPERLASSCQPPPERRPVVFVTHMEHHSNQTSWLETLADVEVMEPDRHGLVDPASLVRLLERYRARPFKIGAFTACSNVTGIFTPYHELARIMHEHGGYCFVDFAAAAPYVRIDMHPDDQTARLDAVYFSPHKFLGGPGTPGVLVFTSDLYHNLVPDHPGGGTVNWTNPWGEHRYLDDIEAREDGGTPGFLQTIKAALAVRLKEAMGVERMLAREHELRPILFTGLRSIPRVHLLADQVEDRLTMFSFYVEDLHYSLAVTLLNDRFGVQARGGCSCAGTYGHYLLHVDPTRSRAITEKIDGGDLSDKPGWVRLSLHPTTTNEEAEYLVQAVREVTAHGAAWSQDYRYCPRTNEFIHTRGPAGPAVEGWFEIGAPETD